jgi:hypothetical protein
MAQTLKFGNGTWATKKGSTLAYNDENNNYKPLPFDFSRGSSATRVNKDGLIETVGSGQPRIDYKDNTKGALLLEPTRTNRVTYSEDFSNSVWSTWQSTKTLSNNINPKGTNGYYEISHTGSSSNNPNTRLTNVSLNGSYTLSFFIKINQSRYISLSIEDYNGDRARVYFDTINKTFTTISNVGSPITNTSYSEFSNGWIKISLSVNLLNAVYNEVGIGIYNPSGSFPSASGEVISVFGAQLEQGSYPTSYIPTSGQANGVTRLADSCSQTPPDGVIGQTEGTVYMDFIAQNSNGQSQSHFWLGASGNEIGLYGGSQFIFYSSGGVSINGGNIVTGQRYKVAFGYKANDYVAYVNGNQVGTDTSATVPTMSGLALNSYFNGTEVQKKNTTDFKLYNTRLTNSELQALTTI